MAAMTVIGVVAVWGRVGGGGGKREAILWDTLKTCLRQPIPHYEHIGVSNRRTTPLARQPLWSVLRYQEVLRGIEAALEFGASEIPRTSTSQRGWRVMHVLGARIRPRTSFHQEEEEADLS
ncbi:hypothetical protein BaRGS_00040151, partial [Batillaria attramentaria]